MPLGPALRSEERVTRPGRPSNRLTRTFEASLFPKEELVPSGNPTFPRFPKEPRFSRKSNFPAIPEGATFQPEIQPSRDSRRSHVSAGKPTFP
jgi:hypothetical protein